MVAVLAACAGLAFTGLPAPVIGDLWVSKAYADGRMARGGVRWKRAVGANGYHMQRVGYYSYTYRDVIATPMWPWTLFRRYATPLSELQSPAGPFDSGFFFDSDLGVRFNNAPYPR
jgi:hypothetical protein